MLERLLGVLIAHADGDYFAALCFLLLERGLDGELVPGVDDQRRIAPGDFPILSDNFGR